MTGLKYSNYHACKAVTRAKDMEIGDRKYLEIILSGRDL